MERIEKTDWPLLLTIAGSAIAIVATSVGLWLHVDNKFESFQLAMFNESKDFHARLERQDADFKAHMTYYHSERK